MALLALCTSLLVVLLAYFFWQKFTASSKRALLEKLPILEVRKHDFLAVSRKGYVEYSKRGQAYRLRTDPSGKDDRVMLPMKYLDEVKTSSETAGLSFLLFSNLAMLLDFSGGPQQTPACTYAIKQFLNKNLTNLVPLIGSGITTDMKATFPPTSDWTSSVVYPGLLSIIARNAARVLADPELTENEEWIQISIGITIQTFVAATSIRQRLSSTWYWLAKFIDQPTKDILQCRRRAAQIIEPIYERRKAKARSEAEKPSPTSTGMTWLLSAPGRKEPSVQEVADDLLFLSIAGIHTTTASLMIAIHDLISHPEALKPLREEVDKIYPSSSWKPSDPAALLRLDSFMKESQRMHPMGMLTMSRAPYTDYTFQDGLQIPAHTIVSMASQEFNMDPDNHHNPEVFNAERFLNLKEADGSNKYAFTSVATDHTINFGAGQHACPGRSLAGTAIKFVLAELLRNYDIKFKDAKQPPVMVATALGRSVDPTAELLIRTRQ